LYKIVFQIEALQDIQDAYHWYESQLKDLGEDFLEELEKILTSLKQNPQYFGIAFDDFRDARLTRFPYLIVFKIEGKNVFINSVRHTRRSLYADGIIN
jgi:toxin ParE1/3/4